MVCLKNCHICGISILDDDLCKECMRALSYFALKGGKIDKKSIEEIKNIVIEERRKEEERKYKEQLEKFNKCQCCGRSFTDKEERRKDSNE